MRIAIAADHAGIALKAALKEAFTESYSFIDLGTDNSNSVDYPDFAHALADALKQGKAEFGILVCGSGIGMSIAANRHEHIRAALCRSGLEARLSRQHNDSNVLCLGERITGIEVAKDCVREFLATAFEAGRHQKRVDKLNC